LYVFLTLFIFLFLFLRFYYNNIELIAYLPSLAHNPPPFKNFCHLPSTHVVSRSGAPGPQIAPPDARGGGDAGANSNQQPNMDVSVEEEDRMPPKIRKKWMHRELEALSLGGAREASLSPWSWSRSSGGGGQELDGIFRGTDRSAGRMGLGIRIEDDQFYRSMCFGSRQYR
jgi:hypothetical protein